MEENNKVRIKAGIYLCSILMMGAIAVVSNIANIAAAFPDGRKCPVRS